MTRRELADFIAGECAYSESRLRPWIVWRMVDGGWTNAPLDARLAVPFITVSRETLQEFYYACCPDKRGFKRRLARKINAYLKKAWKEEVDGHGAN